MLTRVSRYETERKGAGGFIAPVFDIGGATTVRPPTEAKVAPVADE